jgi:hypothetical protein
VQALFTKKVILPLKINLARRKRQMNILVLTSRIASIKSPATNLVGFFI